MSSQQLLKETQKAAGAQHLTAWHGKLIEEDKNVTQYLDVSRSFLVRCSMTDAVA